MMDIEERTLSFEAPGRMFISLQYILGIVSETE